MGFVGDIIVRSWTTPHFVFDFIAPEATSPRLCVHTALRPEARLYGIAGFKAVSCRIDPFGPNRRFLVPCPANTYGLPVPRRGDRSQYHRCVGRDEEAYISVTHPVTLDDPCTMMMDRWFHVSALLRELTVPQYFRLGVAVLLM